MWLKMPGELPAKSNCHVDETAKAEGELAKLCFNTDRPHCKWHMLHNFALMSLENFQHFSNLSNIWFNSIVHRLCMCKLNFSRRLAESDNSHSISQVYGLITAVI
jgi:hypothetical protein